MADEKRGWWPKRVFHVFQADFSFGGDDAGVTKSLHLVVASMFALILVLIAWAITSQQTVKSSPAAWPDVARMAASAFYRLGCVLTFCLTASLVGALLGFLFGIPRPISDNTGGTVEAGLTTEASKSVPRRAWVASTNLTQVSDWLTKILLGVGLVQARQGWHGYHRFCDTVGTSLLAGMSGSGAIFTISGIGAALLGFIYMYLYTQLVLARLLAHADSDLNASYANDKRELDQIQAFTEVLAPRIALLAPAEPGPSEVQFVAAARVSAIPLEQVTNQTRRIWARARAIMNDYGAAATAYIALIQEEEALKQPGHPDANLLLEAARVFKKLDQDGLASQMLTRATQCLDTASTDETKAAIVADAFTLKFRDNPAEALAFLNKYWPEEKPPFNDKNGRLSLSRAIATSALINQENRDKLFPSFRKSLKDAIRDAGVDRVRRYYRKGQLGAVTPELKAELLPNSTDP